MKFELEPDNRGRPDEELLADLLAVAQKLSPASPTIEKYNELGRFSADTLKRRFGGWNKALRKAGLVPGLEQNITPNALIADIRRVASALQTTRLTRAEYERSGNYTGKVIFRLFTKWDHAVTAAGLEPGWNTAITDEELFENLERVWQNLGHQPRMPQIALPLSKYSADTYRRRFGGWRKALEAFVAAVGEEAAKAPPPSATSSIPTLATPVTERRRRTTRTVNWRLRFLTLRSDGFRCKACGRSPANESGVELEVDHVVPWNHGGETEMENLQSLCKRCNGGKSDLPFTSL